MHDAQGIVAACRARLADMNRAVRSRQWPRVADLAADYARLLEKLGDIETMPSVRDEIAQLDIHHRRCMRQLSRQMKLVGEDIASLEAGQKAAQRSREMAATIFRQ